MSMPTRFGDSPYRQLPSDAEGFAALTELALELSWSWNHAADAVWRELDPVLWEQTHHPCDVLKAASRETLERALATPDFRAKLDGLMRSRARATVAPTWFQWSWGNHPSGDGGSKNACLGAYGRNVLLTSPEDHT